ncbi:antiterminator LoaP [Paenibacillus aquistagni]|uniref:antiterminator LoaP n=1 Tax=Paenibacillus aquistagni TaxID=1852522 RepID=UPI00145A3423|nr:antiterminator LoaP [Paenibacillus aquistagni]NMM55563.1 antiterminator LoaP [Paenibacillus aquistagni]
MDWYAIFVETGKEELTKILIQQKLNDYKVKCMIPKRKLPEKRDGVFFHSFKLMFPGYIFLQLKLNYEIYYCLKEIPTVIKILNYNSPEFEYISEDQKHIDESLYFKKIDPEDIMLLIDLVGEEGVLDYSEIFIENRLVTVLNGPLKNLEGAIKKVDKRRNRAKVEFNFLGNKSIFDVGVQILHIRDLH